MADAPEDLKYSKEHEWAIKLDNGNIRIGITDFAQKALGDIVYVDIPEAGTDLEGGQTFGSIESVKAVSDIYSPLDGEISVVNEKLVDDPGVINTDPYGDGWLVEVEPSDAEQYEEMMDEKSYAEYLETL